MNKKKLSCYNKLCEDVSELIFWSNILYAQKTLDNLITGEMSINGDMFRAAMKAKMINKQPCEFVITPKDSRKRERNLKIL